MRIEVFSPCYNEERLLPLYLQWYDFADQITLMDGGSDDRTKEIALANPKVRFDESRGFHADNIDARYVEVANNCWRGSTADWVIVCAIDEFLYHPAAMRKALEAAQDAGATIPLTKGFEMICDEFPNDLSQLPTRGTRNQMHDKRLVFNPRKVAPNYGPGTHTAHPSGEVVTGPIWFNHLHMRFLGWDTFLARNMAMTKFSGTGCEPWTLEKSQRQWAEYSASAQPVIENESRLVLFQRPSEATGAEAVGGWMMADELRWCERNLTGRVIEVGVYHGRTTAALFNARSIDCVDSWEEDVYGSCRTGQSDYDAFLANLQRIPHRDRVKIHRARSPQAADAFPDGYADCVFIDANHDYAAVKADILAWLPKVRPGGMIAGHDFGNPVWPAVEAAVRECFPNVRAAPNTWIWHADVPEVAQLSVA